MKIIAFGHRQNVGKSSAARFLVTELRLRNPGINVVQAGFADKLKDVAYQLFAWTGLERGSYYDTHYDKKNVILDTIGKTPRQLWIGVGNGIRAACDYDDVWMNYLFNSVKADILIINDLRFPGEANGVLTYGGMLFRIDRPGQPKVVDGADEPLELFNCWTDTITNNGSLNDFHRSVLSLLPRIEA